MSVIYECPHFLFGLMLSVVKFIKNTGLKLKIFRQLINPAFAGGGVKRPHFFRRVITPVWRGAAAPNFG